MPPETQLDIASALSREGVQQEIAASREAAATQRSDAERIQAELLQQAKGNRQASLPDAFQSILAAALPAIIGQAVGGKAGLGAGLAGGGRAASQLTKRRDAAFDDARQLLLSQAESAGKRATSAEKTIADLDKESRRFDQKLTGIAEKGRLDPSGTTVNVGGDRPRQRRLAEQLEGKGDVLVTLGQLADEVSVLDPEAKGLQLKATLDPNNAEGQFFRRLKAQATLVGKKALQDRLSDIEGELFRRLLGADDNFISGNAISVGTIRSLVKKMQETTKQEIRFGARKLKTTLDDIAADPEDFAEKLIEQAEGSSSGLGAETGAGGMTLEQKQRRLAELEAEGF